MVIPNECQPMRKQKEKCAKREKLEFAFLLIFK